MVVWTEGCRSSHSYSSDKVRDVVIESGLGDTQFVARLDVKSCNNQHELTCARDCYVRALKP